MREIKRKDANLVLRADRDLYDDVEKIADLDPEFEGVASRVVRKAVREFVDRRLAQIADEKGPVAA